MEQEKNILSDTTSLENTESPESTDNVPVNSASEKCPSIIMETDEVQTETDPVDNVDERKDQCCSTASSNDNIGSKDHISKTNSPVKSHNEKKRVSFADERGLDSQVGRFFCKKVLPEISKCASDDVDVPQGSSGEPLTRRTKRIFKPLTFIPMFHQPGADEHFFDRVRQQGVCLEDIQINRRIIKGLIMVSNLGYQKTVQVRLSTNSWETRTDIPAYFVSSSIDNSTDRFEFVLSVPRMPIGARLVFVIQYVVDGCEFWDNNYGYDYALDCVYDICDHI